MFYGETNTLTMTMAATASEEVNAAKDDGTRSKFSDFPSERPAKAVSTSLALLYLGAIGAGVGVVHALGIPNWLTFPAPLTES